MTRPRLNPETLGAASSLERHFRRTLTGFAVALMSLSCAMTDPGSVAHPDELVAPGSASGTLVTIRIHDPISETVELRRAVPGGVFQDFQQKNGARSPTLEMLTPISGDRLAVSRIAGGLSALVDLGEQRELAAAYGIEPLPLDFYAYPSIRMERGELVLFGQRLHRTRPLRGLEPLSALGQWPEIAIEIGHVYLLRFVPDGALPDGSGDLWWKWLVVEHHPGQSVTLRVQPIERLEESVGER